MAPAWVLLDRQVDMCVDVDDEDLTAAADAATAAAAAAAAAKNKGSVAKASFLPSLQEHTVALLGCMKPEAILPNPPGIATIRLLGCKSHRAVASCSIVACADKGLLVLYAGSYWGPGTTARGCYIVYDAAAGSPLLSTVPPPPLACYFTCIGKGAVVLRSRPPSSAYLLAELATTPQHGLPDAVLHIWRSDSPTPEWIMKEVRLPLEVSPAPGKHIFEADTSFSGPDDSLCWVDLLHGIVVCHHPWGPEDPVFRFIRLPDGCLTVGTSEHPNRPRMEEFRSVAFVGGAIKLVSIEGLLEGINFHQFRLTTWTLSPDLKLWEQDGVFCLKDLFMTDEYRALKMEQQTPVCPVFSACEDAVVYVVVNDVDHVELRDVVHGSMVVRTKFNVKGQYVLGLDMRRNKIISTSPGLPPSMANLTPRLIATEICASQQGAKDRQDLSDGDPADQRYVVCSPAHRGGLRKSLGATRTSSQLAKRSRCLRRFSIAFSRAAASGHPTSPPRRPLRRFLLPPSPPPRPPKSELLKSTRLRIDLRPLSPRC